MEDSDTKTIIFEFNGGIIYKIINKEIIYTDWYLSKLIQYDKPNKDGKYVLYEDYEIAVDIINSIKHNNFIITNKDKINYYTALCDKWTVPQWLTKNALELYNEINHPVKYCRICKTGFKENENSSTSCKTHVQDFNQISNKFLCCGKLKYEEFCKIGYHVK